jgi:hypothetical protein
MHLTGCIVKPFEVANMSNATIPPPSNELFALTLSTLQDQAKRWGLDTEELGVNQMLLEQAETVSQLRAEVLWLHSMSMVRS